jgi:hypothetical protein
MMSSWDYGMGDQVSAEYAAAIAAGFCHLCIVRKPEKEGKPCYKCQEEMDKAKDEACFREEMEHCDFYNSQNIPEGK